MTELTLTVELDASNPFSSVTPNADDPSLIDLTGMHEIYRVVGGTTVVPESDSARDRIYDTDRLYDQNYIPRKPNG